MALYATRTGTMATANIWVNLANFGGQTVNAINVPAGYQSIKQLKVTCVPPGAMTDASGGVFLVRLKGSGLIYGPVDIPVGGAGTEQTGNDAMGEFCFANKIPVDIAIKGGEIWVQGMQYATDMGTPVMAVEVCMTKVAAAKKRYVIRNITHGGTVDTKVAVTTDGDTASAGPILVPSDCNRITRIYSAIGGIALATATGGTEFARLEGSALKDGDVVIPIGGKSQYSTTTGVDGSVSRPLVLPTDLEVNPGAAIAVFTENTGVDSGTPYVAIGLEFGGA